MNYDTARLILLWHFLNDRINDPVNGTLNSVSDPTPISYTDQFGEHFTRGVFKNSSIKDYRTCSKDSSEIVSKDKFSKTIQNPMTKTKPPKPCYEGQDMITPPPPFSSNDTIYVDA
mmetsp:Transcript_77268/g.208576  ORF Transcript_77268/g.208576 Transcript_77268/m.208576 type:complete len:116 (-) Transcript_77268:91-438(-)